MKKFFTPSKNEAQKSKVLITGIAISVALVAFQNCGKMSKVGPEYVNPSAEQKPAIMELDNAQSVVLLGNSSEGFGLYAYNVNVNTGEVLRTMYEVPANDPSNAPVKFCLSEEKRMNLQEQISQSSVCLFKGESNPQKQCSQIYKYPYAIIKEAAFSGGTVGNTYKLGENSSSCSDFHDICTENRDDFLSAIAAALIDIDTSACE